VLDCYRDRPGTLEDTELAGALLAADAALWALLDHVDGPAGPIGRRRSSGSSAYDGTALGRAEVHQATGMLMAQAGTTASVALAALRAAAFMDGRRIVEVAADVVARRRRLAPDGSWRTVPDAPRNGRPPPRPAHEHGDDDEREDREDP
jgi:hypothetical protein